MNRLELVKIGFLLISTFPFKLVFFAIVGSCINPVTLLSVVEGKEEVFLFVAEGESVEGPILQNGNTNSRNRFTTGAKESINQWSKNGPAYHCGIGVGHIAGKIQKLGHLLNIKVVKIC